MVPVGSIADEKGDSSNDKEQSFSQSTSETKQQDHYALLGLSGLRCLASLDDIKNNFKPIQEAYAVLSDPIRRSNYDSTDCAQCDFFKFYGPVFSRYEGWSVNQPVPSLGDDKTSMKDVDSFYDFWNTFKSLREFPHADERQNEKAREEESARISSLVQTAYKRDPRIMRRKEEEEKAAEAIMRRKEEEEKAAEVASPEVRKKQKKLLRRERDRLTHLTAHVSLKEDVNRLRSTLNMEQLKSLCNNIEGKEEAVITKLVKIAVDTHCSKGESKEEMGQFPSDVGKKKEKPSGKEEIQLLSDTLKYPEGTSRGSEAIPESIGTTRRSAEEIPKEIHVEEIPKATKTDLVQKPDSTKSFDSTKSMDSSTNATEGHAPKSEKSGRNKVKRAKKTQKKEAAEKRQEEDKKADEEQQKMRKKEKKLLQKEKARLRKLTTDDFSRRLLNLTQKDVDNFCTSLNMDGLKNLGNIIESLDMDGLKSVCNKIESVKMPVEAHCSKDESKDVMGTPSSKGKNYTPSNSPPSSTSNSPSRFSGNLGSINFMLQGQPHEFKHGSVTREYYEGCLIREGGKYKEDVCFICFKKSAEANKIYELSKGIDHPRVMRPRFCIYDDVTSNHLVCYDRFEELRNADSKYSMKLDAPTSDTEIRGYPNDVVRAEIKGLVEAFRHLISEKVSSTLLNKSTGYVWCRKRRMAKILLVDTLLKNDGVAENHIDRVAENHIARFKNGIRENFLVGDWPGPERTYFLDCLTNVKIDYIDRLRVVSNHPFLGDNISKIVRFFPDIFHALNSDMYYDDTDLWPFHDQLENESFISQFLKDKKWTRKREKGSKDSWSLKFQAVFDHPNATPYKEEDMGDLFRFLRNVYIHNCGTTNGMTMKQFFEEIKKNWPGLIELCYEKVYELL